MWVALSCRACDLSNEWASRAAQRCAGAAHSPDVCTFCTASYYRISRIRFLVRYSRVRHLYLTTGNSKLAVEIRDGSKIVLSVYFNDTGGPTVSTVNFGLGSPRFDS